MGLASDHDSGPLESLAEKDSPQLPLCPTLTNTPDTSAVWSHSQPTQCGNTQVICNFVTVCV